MDSPCVVPPEEPTPVPRVAFGTAHLYGPVDALTSGLLLAAAWDAGLRRFDTAPSYGHGLSEPALGTFLAGRADVEMVSTKVGLSPAPPPTVTRRVVRATARTALPAPVTQRLRRSRPSGGGHFDADEVRDSVHRSLRHLGGRVDRLLLHEIQPDDVGDDLLAALHRFVEDGDVAAVGVATQNHSTPEVVQRCGPLVTVAHLAAGPLHPPVPLPAHVRTRVGHGLLGHGGGHLGILQDLVRDDARLRKRWEDATAATVLAGPGGLADALLARATRLDLTDVVVATSRPQRVARTYACASGAVPLEDAAAEVLDALVGRALIDPTS